MSYVTRYFLLSGCIFIFIYIILFFSPNGSAVQPDGTASVELTDSDNNDNKIEIPLKPFSLKDTFRIKFKELLFNSNENICIGFDPLLFDCQEALQNVPGIGTSK